MATSSRAFIAQPNFLAASKRNVFTKVRSWFFFFFFFCFLKTRDDEREPQGVMMTCKNKNKNSFSPPRWHPSIDNNNNSHASFLSLFHYKQASSKSRTRTAGGRGSVVQTKAFFNFGGKKKEAAGQPMVCIDCGYIYRGDFSALPNSYRCPTCGVGKNRFKAAMTPAVGVAPPKRQAPTFNTAGVLAEKKRNKEAFRARRAAAGKSKSPRELAREKMLEEQAKKDSKKGGGFFGR